jgi:hypothetical protein
MSHWNSYNDDPFFYEQNHNEERVDNSMQWEENNAPLNVPMPAQMPATQMPNVPMPAAQMPAAQMPNVPMPAVPMPTAPMPTAFYPFPPMYCCPPVTCCYPYPMVGGMTPFVDDDFDSPDMVPQAMPLGMENAPHTTMDDTESPMSENLDPAAAQPMQTGGAFAPSPMFPIAGMAPIVPFPTCSPIMPLGTMPTVYYTPASYYGGAAPYGPFFPVPHVLYW